ncbi:hypothetical protein PG987_010294 [Apiospora arundinis]
MRNLKEASELAKEMAVSLRSCADVDPDAFLIWETLAADVESREGYGSTKPATLYGDMADQYSRFDGPSNRSYEYLHRALHAFYTGDSRWEMALHYVTSAAEHLDQVVFAPSRDTESIIERRLAILVMKVTVLEAMGNTAAAIHAYSDIMAACAQDQDGEMYVEQWHQVADNRITMLKLAQSQGGAHPHDKGKLPASSGTILPAPPIAGSSSDGQNEATSVQEGQQSSPESNLVSHQPVEKTTQTLVPAHTTPAGINTAEEPEPTKKQFYSFLDRWATEDTARTLRSQGPNNTSTMPETKPQQSASAEGDIGIGLRNTMDYIYTITDRHNYKTFLVNEDHSDIGRYPEMDKTRLTHALHVAAAMDAGRVDGTRPFYPPSGSPTTAAPIRPYTLVPGLDTEEVPADAWLPEEGAVLAHLAQRGAMRLRSDALFRMVWCYASGHDRAYLATLQAGRRQQLLTARPAPVRKTRGLAYFLGERYRMLGEPMKGPDGGDLYEDPDVCLAQKGNRPGSSVYHASAGYHEEAKKDAELVRSLRDLADAAQEVLLRQRRKLDMERQKQQHEQQQRQSQQEQQQEPIVPKARSPPIMVESPQESDTTISISRPCG